MYRDLSSFRQLFLSILCASPFLFCLLAVGKHGCSTLGLSHPCSLRSLLTSLLCSKISELLGRPGLCIICVPALVHLTGHLHLHSLKQASGFPPHSLFSSQMESFPNEGYTVMKAIHLRIKQVFCEKQKPGRHFQFSALSRLISKDIQEGIVSVPSKTSPQSFHFVLSPLPSPNPAPIASDLVSGIPFFFLQVVTCSP